MFRAPEGWKELFIAVTSQRVGNYSFPVRFHPYREPPLSIVGCRYTTQEMCPKIPFAHVILGCGILSKLPPLCCN